MQIKRRIRRTLVQYITVAVTCIVVIGVAAVITVYLVIGQVKDEYQMQMEKVNEEIEANERIVYVAKSEIKRGDTFSEDNVEMRNVFSSQPEETFISSELFGKIALIDISHGSHIMNTMASSNYVTSILRELECNAVYISSNITNNDIVDIRLQYPNGESYIVLSKKNIKGIIADMATCYLWVEEDEILRLSAAIVDASLYKGSMLYIAKYIEPNIQEASIITYTPSLSVLSLIENSPNIVERCSQELNKEIRKALENRLTMSMEVDVSKINWNLDTNDKYLTNINKHNEDDENKDLYNDDMDDNVLHNNAMDLGNVEEGRDNDNRGSDYLYYIEEEQVKAGDIEYGQ